jgi:hypothetical protein
VVDPDDVAAALRILQRLGVSPGDLQDAAVPRAAAPTFAEYIPVVYAAMPAGRTRDHYNTYWDKILGCEGWAGRRLDEPTVSELKQLVEHLRAVRVRRRNSRDGRSVAKHVIDALRCLYNHAEADGRIDPAGNAAAKLDKPPQLESARYALPPALLAEINRVAAATGDDPDLDVLLLRLHTETACRRAGALGLRPCDLDPTRCVVLLREKGGTQRWQPVSPTLMRALCRHSGKRGDGVTYTYVRATPEEVAAAVAALTGEAHPLADGSGHQTPDVAPFAMEDA